MSPAIATFLLEAVNFLLLAGLLGYFLFQPVRQALERRRSEAEKEASNAAAKLAEAERLHSEAEKERAALERELRTREAEAKTRAETEAKEILARARENAEKERTAAKRALGRLSDAELVRLGGVVAEAAGKTVRKLLSELDPAELDRTLLRAACRELQENEGEPLGEVVIETARPLDGTGRREVEEALGNRGQNAAFRVVPGLGAGARITTRRGVFDATIGGLAGYARRVMEEALSDDSIDEEKS